MVGLAFAVGATVGGVVVVAVPPMVIGLPLTVPVCCWLTATAATAPMATKPLAIAPAMSNLTRWCLIDSTVTPPIGPRRSRSETSPLTYWTKTRDTPASLRGR